MLHKDSWPSVKQADSIMSEWRKLVPTLPNGQELLMIPQVQTCMSYGDTLMGAYTLNVTLPGEGFKKYRTCQSLAHDVDLILDGILKAELNSPWSAHPVTDSQGSSQSKDVGAQRAIVRGLSPDATMKDSALMLTEAGLAVGQHVRRKADQESGMLVAIESGRVKLKQPSGSLARASIDSFLAGHWQSSLRLPRIGCIHDCMSIIQEVCSSNFIRDFVVPSISQLC